MLNQFSRMAIGRGNNILTSCQPMHSGSSRMRELPACVFTFSEKKNKIARYASKWDAALFKQLASLFGSRGRGVVLT